MQGGPHGTTHPEVSRPHAVYPSQPGGGEPEQRPGRARSLTLEAATSWAVLAAISWEQTMSSSYLPV